MVEAHLRCLQMVTPGDEYISCTPELSLLASHTIASQPMNNRYVSNAERRSAFLMPVWKILYSKITFMPFVYNSLFNYLLLTYEFTNNQQTYPPSSLSFQQQNERKSQNASPFFTYS